MVLKKTTRNEVSMIFKSLNNKYSTGPHGISYAILKSCSPIIETYLCTFNNLDAFKNEIITTAKNS